MTGKASRRLKIEYVDPHTLKPWKGNPRVMSAQDHEKLKTGLREFSDIVEGGIVDPLIVRRRDNLVIGGHQRLEDVLKLGLPRVPIVRIDISERRMKALNLALNRIHGDWDEDKLASILAELKDLPEVDLTGFDESEIDRIIADAGIPDLRESTSKAESPHLSLVPYFGGKQATAPYLVSMIPEHTAYVEVFGGGASVLLNKPPSPIEVYNDLDGELVNLFETIRESPDRFLRRAHYLLYSRELYERWTKEFAEGGQPSSDPVERALRFWYIIRSGHGAQVGAGWAFSRAVPRHSGEVLQNNLGDIQAIHERLKNVEIDHLDFRQCIENRDAPSSFLFLDPPYLDVKGYRVCDFGLEEHQELARILRDAEGKWLMTIGDHPKIRELYPGQIQGTLKTFVSADHVIAAEGEKREEQVRNLIISNYPLPQQVLQVAT